MKGKVEFDPEDLLEQILGVLRIQCPVLPEHTWRPLGHPLKQLLRQLGEEAKYQVWMAGTTGEYLWDVAWTYETDDAYWIELASEIELSDMTRKWVLDDFYKVLDAKARLKLFVTATTMKMAKELQTDIEWAVAHQRFRLPGERLIALLVTYDGRANAYKAATRVFDGSGPIGVWIKGWQDVPLGRGK
jgi:hypothetical protein